MRSRTHAPTYHWRGLDAQGKPHQGTLEAADAELARALLRHQGFQVDTLQRQWWSQKKPLSHRVITAMTRQWAALLRAGVSMVPALEMLQRSTPQPSMASVLEQIQRGVESGQPLSQALGQHPQVFGPLYVSMVHAGESAGILETMMERLAQTLEKNEKLRARLRAALTYPLVVVVLALAVLVLMLLFVVPVFEEVFQSFGADLPWATQMVVALSESLSTSGPLVATSLLLALLFWQRAQAVQRRIRGIRERWLLKLPLLGPLIGTAVVARWAQTLSALLAAGVPLAEALGPVAQACDHSVYARVTGQLQRQVAQGSRLSEGMAQSGRFPDMLVQLCATGEETGAMDSLLARAGGLMETEVDDRVNGLSSLLEPLIIVLLGGLIGGILVAMYLPIFRLGQVF